MKTTYQFPRPAVTVDCVVFGFDEGELKLLLIKRNLPPFAGRWALPGGFVRLEESVDVAAKRELEEEAGVNDVFLEQLYTFGAVNREPRERVISIAYYALVKAGISLSASTDAADAAWFAISQTPRLAFDHTQIVDTALSRLRAKVRYQPLGFELLDEKFSLSQLQHLYEAIIGIKLDKRNFRKKILKFGLLQFLKEKRMFGAHRPAQLFSFDRKKYNQLREIGFNFEI